MEQLPFYDETTIRHQFDTKCRLALKSELKDYLRYLRYRGKHEVSISDLPESQFNALNWLDDYEEDICHLKACEYDIKIKDVLLAEAYPKSHWPAESPGSWEQPDKKQKTLQSRSVTGERHSGCRIDLRNIHWAVQNQMQKT